MSEYTPITAEVRGDYKRLAGSDADEAAAAAEFDRWLAEVERAAAEKALVAAADAVGDPRFKDDQNTATLGEIKRWLRECAASYRRNEGESE